jgi:hypothetical protein
MIPSGATIAAAAELGFTHATIVVLSAVNLVILALYLFHRTQVIAAVMLTGYFGGATAVLLRDSQPILPPTLIILTTWVAVILRNPDVLRVALGMQLDGTADPQETEI